ncbi:MAG: hypothetical protein EBT00_11960 [Proteobacteria bacterium]|nr:hypothetical protein [Pseudomonadota bacterium]
MGQASAGTWARVRTAPEVALGVAVATGATVATVVGAIVAAVVGAIVAAVVGAIVATVVGAIVATVVGATVGVEAGAVSAAAGFTPHIRLRAMAVAITTVSIHVGMRSRCQVRILVRFMPSVPSAPLWASRRD